VDVSEVDPERVPVTDIRTIVAELKKHNRKLATRERWLVLNKIDALPPDSRQAIAKKIRSKLRWKGPIHAISGVTGEGCHELMLAIEQRLINNDTLELEGKSGS
jgi:GTP-binding protein